MTTEYISNIKPNATKKEESETLKADIINFIAEGGKIDVYNNNGSLSHSHVKV